MEKSQCAPGSWWDSLTKHCIPGSQEVSTPAFPPPVLKPVLSTRGLEESWSSANLSVWICVGLVANGSILVLLLWFIIYRRHRRTSQSTGEKDSTPRTPTTIEQEEEALTPLPHVNGQTQEMPINTCGRSLCNGWAEHGLPLPATELGDSALVTAKT